MTESKTFRAGEDNKFGCADLSYCGPLGSSFKEIDSDWWMFNRLYVPPKFRNKGIGKELMEKVVQWADVSKVDIILGINSYGDLNWEQLRDFYARYEFKYFKDGVMYRYHKGE